MPKALTLNDGGNPDGIEPHALDIVELALETLEGSTTVSVEVTASGTASISGAASDTIGQGKVDVARLPILGAGSESRGYLQRRSEQGREELHDECRGAECWR